MSDPTIAWSARLAVLGAALLWSGNSAFIKACSLTGWQIASLRSGVAALVFLLVLPDARRRPNARALLVACAYASTMLSFALANRLTTGASAVFLQATAPFWVLLVAPSLLRERATRGDVIAMLALAAGMALFFVGTDTPSVTAPAPLAGNVLGVVSGVSWALTVIGFRRLGRDEGSGSAVASALVGGNAIAFFAGLPAAWPFGAIAMQDAIIIGWLGAFSIALAYLLFARGVREVSALEASLLCLIEPTLNPVWTWLAHDEEPRAWSLVGGALILGTTVVKTWLDTRRVR